MTDALPTGETALWRAVVVQAFQDATYGLHGAGRKRRGRCRADRHARVNASVARAWLLRDSADFRRVCALAGLEPDAVRSTAKVAIERSDVERRECTGGVPLPQEPTTPGQTYTVQDNIRRHSGDSLQVIVMNSVPS